MKIEKLLLIVALFLPLTLLAQGPPPPGGPGGARGFHPSGPDGGHREMGKWWKNSELAKKLQLTDQQTQQLDKIYFDHRMKLIDNQADLEKQDLKLQALLDQDSPNESEVGSQVDQELAAKSKLEREFTMMNLSLRKVLTVEQWRKLKEIHEHRGPEGFGFPRDGRRDGFRGGPGQNFRGGHGGPNGGPMPPPASNGNAPPANQ